MVDLTTYARQASYIHIRRNLAPCGNPIAQHLSWIKRLHIMSNQGLTELSIFCVVKGYHEYTFEVNVGETFLASKKRVERGNAFKVTIDRGQLGHLHIET